jgi:hypothetical protein
MGPLSDEGFIEIVNGNLFQIAATYLGDAMQWGNIARLNNLSDPFVIGAVRIRIPVYSPAFSDGFGPQ